MIFSPRRLIDFYLLGRHRLETVKLLPLGATIRQAVALYGEPIETGPSQETTEITEHIFAAGPYHQVVAAEWRQTIQAVTYWSEKPTLRETCTTSLPTTRTAAIGR